MRNYAFTVAFTIIWMFIHGVVTGQPLPFLIMLMGSFVIYGLVERFWLGYDEALESLMDEDDKE